MFKEKDKMAQILSDQRSQLVWMKDPKIPKLQNSQRHTPHMLNNLNLSYIKYHMHKSYVTESCFPT